MCNLYQNDKQGIHEYQQSIKTTNKSSQDTYMYPNNLETSAWNFSMAQYTV